jgi:OFA family oxalate/formate antiporter-like MFS transporter
MERRTAALVRAVPFFYGWWVVIAAGTIILIASIAPLYLFSTLVDPLEDEFGWSRAAIGAGPSIAAVMAGLTMPVAGYLVDRVGARRLLVTGVTLVGGGFLVMSQIQALWQFYISASIIAVGMSLAGLPVCTVAIAHWFEKRRGRALGIVCAGEGASGVMVLVAALLIAVFEWRTGLMILSIGQLAICIPLALTVRNRPEEVGLLPDGEPPASGEPSAGPLPEAAEGPGSPGSGMRQPEGLTIGQALRTRSFWLLAFAQVLAWVGSFAIVIHVIAYLDESGGFTEEGAAVIAMGIPFGSLVGRLGFGWLADYLGKRRLLATAWILQGLGTLIFAGIYSPWQAVIFLIVFTPGWGGASPLLPALLAEYFGLRAFGIIQGVLMATAMLGAVAGPIFAGAVYDVVDSYRPAFLVLALMAFTAVVLVQMMGRRPTWTGDVAVAPTT